MGGMQMVERPWGVAAYGAASVKAMPDLVRVRFKIICLVQTPAESFARASGSVRTVREVLRGHGIPDGGVERSRLRLRSAWNHLHAGRGRRKAVGAARDKAALYAEAAGTRLGPVVHIDDVDPESADAELYRGHRFGSGDASAEDLAPGHVVVSAAVIVGCSLIHG